MIISDYSLSGDSREIYVYSHKVYRYNEQRSDYYEDRLIMSINEIINRQIKL